MSADRAPPAIAGVHHLAIKAREVEPVAAFYRDILGLTEQTRHLDDAGQLRSIWLETGGTLLMIERSTSGRAEGAREPRFLDDPPGLHLLALRISARDRTNFLARLESFGVEVVHRTDYTLYVFDPEGNRIALSSYPERG